MTSRDRRRIVLIASLALALLAAPATLLPRSSAQGTTPPAVQVENGEAPAGEATAAETGGAGPGTAEARFQAAGADYEAGRFEQAARIYESLLADGYDDPRIYYNLGNARFKEGRLGLANLAYERALERDPSDADAKENLAYANLVIADKVGGVEEEFPASLLAALEKHFGADRAVLVLTILALASGLAALPLWFAPSRTVRGFGRAALGVLLPAALLVACAAAVGIARPGSSQHAIILADSADGRSAPASDGTVLFTVHEGLKVEVRGERPGWIQITLPNGLTGWVETARAERI